MPTLWDLCVWDFQTQYKCARFITGNALYILVQSNMCQSNSHHRDFIIAMSYFTTQGCHGPENMAPGYPQRIFHYYDNCATHTYPYFRRELQEKGMSRYEWACFACIVFMSFLFPDNGRHYMGHIMVGFTRMFNYLYCNIVSDRTNINIFYLFLDVVIKWVCMLHMAINKICNV